MLAASEYDVQLYVYVCRHRLANRAAHVRANTAIQWDGGAHACTNSGTHRLLPVSILWRWLSTVVARLQRQHQATDAV